MLRLPNHLRGELEALIRAGYPHETCGLLVGRQDPTQAGLACVERVAQARNLNQERAHDRYQLDPADFMQTDLDARAAGQEIVGIWHSHPDHPAEPSETDRLAAWPGWSYVIASVGAEGVTAVRSWRLDNEQRFVEENLQT